MAKGDNMGGIGLGYNPGGPRMGSMATIGSKPPMMQQMQQQPNVPGQTGIGPSAGALPGIMGNGGMKPAVEPIRAQGPMINGGGAPPQMQEMPAVGPSFMGNDAIQNMLKGGFGGYKPNGGTSNVPPIDPNSYALQPSANSLNKNRQY